MLSTLFILFAFWIQPNTENPNFHPSFTAAREAAKKEQKETVVFFTKRTCGNCNAAWASFEKDEMATKRFMSTMIDAEDFDGTVLFDLYQLDQVPCWVVLRADGRLKEKWSGGWKDTSGKPIIIHETEIKGTESKPSTFAITKSEEPTTTNTSASDKNEFVPKSTSTIQPNTTEIDKSESVTPKSTSPLSTSTSSAVKGFELQAGYFGSEANAQKLVTELSGKGVNYFTIQPAQQNGSTFYRVISKSFASETEANEESQVLAGKGIKTTVRSKG